MSYRKNVFLKKMAFVGLTSTAFLISGTAFANKYITSAEKYLDNNDYQAAIIELKNAIKSTPKEALPRLMLGEVYLQRGNFVSAEKELSRAFELGATKEDVVPLLARTYFGQGRNEEAIELIDETNVDSAAAKTELLALKAIAELNLSNIEAAEHTLSLAKDSGYDNLYTKLGQAKLSAAKNDISGALELVDQILAKTKDNSDVWILKGHLETSEKNFAEAANSYKKAYEVSPDAFYFNLFIARALVLAENYPEAGKYTGKVLKASPNHTLANELQATIVYSQDNFEAAKEHADRAINSGSNQTPTLLISALSAYELKLYEQAHNRLVQLKDRLPDDHFAQRLLIVTQLQLGYVNEAVESLNDLEITTDEDGMFLSRASMQLSKLGRDEDALAIAQKANSSADANKGNELMLGLVKLKNKDKSGLENIETVLKDQPDAKKAELGLAQYYMEVGEIDAAEGVADKWLAANPDDPDSLFLKAQILLARKQLDNAEAIYRKVNALAPERKTAKLGLAKTLAAKGDWEEAYKYAYDVTAADATNRAAYQVLIVCAVKLNRIDKVLTVINEQLQSNPAAKVPLTHQKAELLALSKKTKEATNLLESLPEPEKTPRTWELMGDINYSAEKWIDAERAYDRWLELAPTDTRAHMRSVIISERNDKIGAAIKQADAASKIFTSDIRFPLMKAGLLMKDREFEASQKVLDSLDPQVKETPYALRIQGMLSLATRDFNTAIAVYKKRYKQKPSLIGADQLATVYLLNKQYDEGIAFLEGVMRKYPEKSKQLKVRLAELQTHADPRAAVSQYEAILAENPKNIIALNNIAMLYVDAGDSEKAASYAKQAYELANDQPAILDTYGYTSLKNGDYELASKLLSTAYEKLPNNAEVALHYSESLIKTNKHGKASSILASVETEEPKLVVLKENLEKQLKR